MRFHRFLFAALPAVLSSLPLAAQSDLRFGAQTHFAQGWDPVWADIAAVRHVWSVRDELYWNQIETQPGVYAFPTAFDDYMWELQFDQITPLITLDFANPLYDNGQTPYTAQGIAGYANYAAAVLDHYGSQIQAVEIWDEYNGSYANGPATSDLPGTYNRMLQAAYARIKAVRPDVTVVGGATAGVPLPYWEALMQDGALSSMDVLSIHPYRYQSAPEGIENDVAKLQALVLKYNHGQPKPIWVTEIGWFEQHSTVPGELQIDDTVQAEYLVRAYALLLSAGVQRLDWYMLRDDQGIVMGTMDPRANPRISSFALQVMATELQGAPFMQKEAAPAGVYSMLFTQSSGKPVRVMWSLQPVTLAVTGQTSVLDLSGNQLGTSGPLKLSESPIFVEGALQGLQQALAAAGPAETELADSSLDFAGIQGQNGWTYGTFMGNSTTLQPLASYNLSNWEGAWGGPFPYLEISAGDQEPSFSGSAPVWAVRRWTSDCSASVHVTGQFQVGTQSEGVSTEVLVNGVPAFSQFLSPATTVSQNFNLTLAVAPGTTIDFAVGPAPDLNLNFDATTVAATIARR